VRDEIIGRMHTLEFFGRLLVIICVLPPEHLEHTTCGNAEQGRLASVRMCHGVEVNERTRVLVAIVGFHGWPMEDVERFLDNKYK
jgi:hypothetical protein